jgi:hypothetical protein
MVPKFKNIYMVVMKQGGTAEAALDVLNGTVDGTTKTIVCFLLPTGFLYRDG